MSHLNVIYVITFFAFTFVQGIRTLEYKDLEDMDAFCPDIEDYYMCNGKYSLYDEKGCNCDAACKEYQDCCIDSPERYTKKSSIYNYMTCMPVSEGNMGAYAIVTCPDSWVGPSEIRDKCEGPMDFHDPLFAAPVTSFTNSVTYRNRYCAECNDADMTKLKTFQIKLNCPDLAPILTEEQVYKDMRYDEMLSSWGIDRLNAFGNSTDFHTCDITFQIPDYFDMHVRLCPPNIISSCPPHYKRNHIQKACEEYMAIVYDGSQSYRNPHCAICNGKMFNQVRCKMIEESRRRPLSYSVFLDINSSDCEFVAKTCVPKCPSNHLYDPFSKTCRKLVCVLPDDIVVDGKCVSKPK